MPEEKKPIPTFKEILEQAVETVASGDLSQFKSPFLPMFTQEKVAGMIRQSSANPGSPTYPICMVAMKLLLKEVLQRATIRFAPVLLDGKLTGYQQVTIDPQSILDLEKLFV